MISLDSSTKALKVSLSGTPTSELPIVASRFVPGQTNGVSIATVTSGTSDVTIFSGADKEQVQVSAFSINNPTGNSTATVTVKMTDTAGTTRNIAVIALAVNDTLCYEHGSGLYVLNSAGAHKESGLGVAAVVAALVDNSGGAAADGTIGAVTPPTALTDSGGGTADNTVAAMTLTTSLTDNGGGTADATVAAMTLTTSLTDNGGGTADATVAVMTAAAAITDNGGGSNATDTIAVIGSGATDTSCALTADVKAAVNCLARHVNTTSTAIGAVKDNMKEVTTQLALQYTLNGVIKDNIKEITTQLALQYTLNGVIKDNFKELTTAQAANRTAIVALMAAVTELATKVNEFIAGQKTAGQMSAS